MEYPNSYVCNLFAVAKRKPEKDQSERDLNPWTLQLYWCSALPTKLSSQLRDSSQMACQLTWMSTAPVIFGLWVRILFKPHFSVFLFTTA